MAIGPGVNRVADQIGQIGKAAGIASGELKEFVEELKAVDEHALRTAANMKILSEIAQSARYNTEAMDKSMTTATTTVLRLGAGLSELRVQPGLNPISPEVLDAEGYKAGSYKSQRPNEAAFDAETARNLDDLANRLRENLGPNNYMAAQVSAISTFLKEGRFGAVIALAYLRAILSNWDAGFMSEAADPRNSPAVRALDNEMLAFIHGGNLRGAK